MCPIVYPLCHDVFQTFCYIMPRIDPCQSRSHVFAAYFGVVSQMSLTLCCFCLDDELIVQALFGESNIVRLQRVVARVSKHKP